MRCIDWWSIRSIISFYLLSRGMWLNNSNSQSNKNSFFDPTNCSEVNLWNGEIGRSFKTLPLEDFSRSKLKAIFIKTRSGNIYSIHDSAVFIDKNPRIHSLSREKQSEYMVADYIMINSKTKKIHLIDIEETDKALRLWYPFYFVSNEEKNNTSEIIEIVGDPASRGQVEWNTTDIKRKLIENIK